MRSLKRPYPDVILVMLILLEAAFLLWLSKLLPHTVSEVCNALCSLLIGGVVIWKYWGKRPEYHPEPNFSRTQLERFGPAIVLTIGIIAFIPFAAQAFREIPIGQGSDIILTIRAAVRRLLAGETVYSTIYEWGYPLPLTYLPMQWLPFTISEALRFDYRWVAGGIFYLAALLMVWRCSRISISRGFVVTILTLYFGWMILNHDTGILNMTVEIMVAGYYMLLIMGIGGKNPWLRGAAIALCLLSRYSLVLWLPLWAFIEWMYVDRKGFYRSATMIAALVLLIYIIPFLSKDWSAFGEGYAYYTQAAIGEWDDEGMPQHLDRGIGFARWFYLGFSGRTLPERLHILQQVHFWICLGSSVLMGAAYARWRRRLHPRIFLLASFKIYLSLFLAFIQVPYTYLMITAVAVSIAIFAELGRWRVA